MLVSNNYFKRYKIKYLEGPDFCLSRSELEHGLSVGDLWYTEKKRKQKYKSNDYDIFIKRHD